MYIDDIQAQIRKEEEVIWNAEESIKKIKDDQFTTTSEMDYINRKPAYVVGKEYDDSYYKSVYFTVNEKGVRVPYSDDKIQEDEQVDEVFTRAETMPNWPGCSDEQCTQREIMKFISKNFKYPQISKEYGIEGRVFVSFTIDESGYVTNIEILRGLDKYIDKESIRVVESFPRFSPGRLRGKAVKVKYTIPIKCTLS